VLVALVAILSLLAASCGSDTTLAVDGTEAVSEQSEAASQQSGDAPEEISATVVVTTNILGDIVENLVGNDVKVVTIMGVGADPHDFQASAQQVSVMGQADALVANGAAFEERLLDIISSAEDDGVPLFRAISVVDTIDYGAEQHDSHGDEHSDEEHDEHAEDDHAEDEHAEDEHSDEEHDEHADEHADDDHAGDDDGHSDDEHAGDDDEHSDDEHADDDHSDEDEHGHGHDADATDPHFFVDPARMAVAAAGIANFLIAAVDGIDADAVRTNSDAYIAELEALDLEVEATLAAIPDAQRVMITNHEVFGYFAERYDFEVVGTIIPSGSTGGGASAQALANLAKVIEHEGVPAIFSDTSSSDELANTLASEVGDVAIVELFTESLGPDGSGGASYIEMVRSNADRIVGALAG